MGPLIGAVLSGIGWAFVWHWLGRRHAGMFRPSPPWSWPKLGAVCATLLVGAGLLYRFGEPYHAGSALGLACLLVTFEILNRR